jgi:dehydrogenase/reductase SDR family protein 1
MARLEGKIALVTGASRGIGKGIAEALGAEGATVYITGRTMDEENPTIPLAGTIHETAEAVTKAGGRGIALQCDHREDEQVRAVFKRIQKEQKRLDILVNNAWSGYEVFHVGEYFPPDSLFWKKPLSYWNINLDGLRWSYLSSYFAIPMMAEQKSGLIVNISNAVPNAGNAAYNIAKIGTDRLTWEVAHQVKKYNVAAICLYPGLVRTEGVMKFVQYFDMSNSESPQFTGRAIVELAADEKRMEKSGNVYVVAKLAQEYNFDDIDGKRPVPSSD